MYFCWVSEHDNVNESQISLNYSGEKKLLITENQDLHYVVVIYPLIRDTRRFTFEIICNEHD